jgi:hypothetical protein
LPLRRIKRPATTRYTPNIFATNIVMSIKDD